MENEKITFYVFLMSFLGTSGNFLFIGGVGGDSANLRNHQKRVMNVCVPNLQT